MQRVNRAGGPTSPGSFPVVDVLYEEGVGGLRLLEPEQLFLRQDGKLLFFYPTSPDVPDQEWAVNVDRVVTLRFCWTCVLEESDFS
ncbi:hypothetical protein SEA_GHOBES_38 [Gordonia phage Ghobes]|uniref:Uncharacterized protein n=1 Tax=Gordonia phage Ghobes TaxID=1887647 RepID=A0A1B3B075_9CAUD|nr:hypothetical protein KCH37_gp38 [Gordonia phage Ghobes]AOE44389.1 hypothetical protein SEA_GHOBES_38 [Gordonia phage Ghobes]